SDLPARLRDRRGRARGAADALRDRRPAPRGGADGPDGCDPRGRRARAVRGRRVHGAELLRVGRVSATSGDDEPETHTGEEAEQGAQGEPGRPWWSDGGIMVPVFSGVAFVSGLVLEWSGLAVPALVLFWIGLLLGASTFTPGAIRKLFKGKLSISLLMTISAI